MIWDVNISAIDDESMEAARHILKSFGVYPGASMHDIDTNEISMKLVLEIENIKWANVYKNGTVINVELCPDEKYAGDEFGDKQERAILYLRRMLL